MPRKIIRPTIDDIARYASFNPKPALIGPNGSGALVVDEASGLMGNLRPRLQERFYLDGRRLFTVEYVLHNPSSFTELSDEVKEAYVGLRKRWHDFSERHPYAAKAIKIGAMVGTGGALMFWVSGCGDNGNHNNNPTPIPTSYQCSDGADNDSDGFIDYPNDPDCTCAQDNVELDTAPPGRITDLIPTSPTGNVEQIELNWTGVGDDSNQGRPQVYLVRYSDSPIVTVQQWDAALNLPDIAAQWDAGVVYRPLFDNVPAGNLCFAIRAMDEVGNVGEVSNSPCADVISKAEYYVNFWIGSANRIELTYPEAVAMLNNASQNPTYRARLAAEMINGTDQFETPMSSIFPNGQADLQKIMLLYTDRDYDTSELNNPNDPFGAGNFELISPTMAFVWDERDLTSIHKYITMNLQVPSGTTPQSYCNLTQTNIDNTYAVIREVLIDYVNNNKGLYDNLIVGVGGCDPGWNNSLNKTCGN